MARALRSSTDDLLLVALAQRIARMSAEDGEVLVRLRASDLISQPGPHLLPIRGDRISVPNVVKLLNMKGFHYWDGSGVGVDSWVGRGCSVSLGWLSWGEAGAEVFRRFDLVSNPAYESKMFPHPWVDDGVLQQGYYSHFDFNRYFAESVQVQELSSFIFFNT